VTVDEQLARLVANVVEVYTEDELRARLAENRPLRVKLGVDPTAPDIHLGHTLALRKLREFQDLGHQAIVIIGDFTARIGDPSGRSTTRPQLGPEEIAANAETYLAQIFKVLRPERTEVRRNAEWLASMSFEDVIRLAARMTVARMLERDDFQARYRGGIPIGVHEFLYPLMQGYDSVVVRADVELGGTDQTFNLLVGRELQAAAGLPRQIAIVLPLLEGLDGTQKMSKSLGNHVGIADAPHDMYGKLMSIPDRLLVRYLLLLSDRDARYRDRVARGEIHPMEAKKALAREIVERFHGPEAAATAERFFEERFQHRQAYAPTPIRLEATSEDIWICDLLKRIGFVRSTSEARRLVTQGAVRVDDRPVDLEFRFRPGVHRLVGVGRRRLATVEFGKL